MLFEEEKKVYQKPARPVLPASHELKYDIGFLFNLVKDVFQKCIMYLVQAEYTVLFCGRS